MSLLHLYSPALCPLCEAEVEEVGLCARCALPRLSREGRCSVCFSILPADGYCAFCSSRNVFFDSYKALHGLDERTAPLIRKLKFENERWLVRLFTESICDVLSSFPCERIGWISSGRLSHRTRPYQPIADLASAVSHRTGIASGGDIMKSRRGKQSAARYESRFFDLPGSLRLTGMFKKVEHYLLLEDIFTTGATANESARLLKKVGVKEVHVISLFQRQRDGLVWTPLHEVEKETLTS